MLLLALAALAVPLLAFLRRRLFASTSRRTVSYREVSSVRPGKGRKVVVTGGTGFVGRWLVTALLDKFPDDDIWVFDMRLPRKLDRRVTFVQGDLCDPAHVARVLQDADTVFHMAGVIPHVGMRDETIMAVNLGGTRIVVDACISRGVKHLVYTSSATVVVGADDYSVRGVDETRPYPSRHIGAYGKSKELAEEYVLAAREQGLKVVVCRPAGVFGIGDKQIADVQVSGKAPYWLGSGEAGIDFVDVESVVHGHVCAAEALRSNSKVNGQVYNIGSGTSFKYKTMMGATRVWGYQGRGIPFWIVQCLATLNEACAWAFGWVPLDPALSTYGITFTQRTYFFSIAKAKRDLGYEPLYDVPAAIERIKEAYKSGTAQSMLRDWS